MDSLTPTPSVHPVDEILPVSKLFAYGLQHVLAMYSGAVAVPIILAQALNLPAEQLIHLINADLFTCGIATLIQTLGFWKVGARIPMIQGVTFAAVTPMCLIGVQHGLPAMYGAIIAAGLVTFLVAPFFSLSLQARSLPSSALPSCRFPSSGLAVAAVLSLRTLPDR